MRAYVPVFGVMLLLLPKAINADTLCQNCLTLYSAPGGSAGAYRMDSCPVCTARKCDHAAEQARKEREIYLIKRKDYEDFKKTLQDKADREQTVTQTERDKLETMRAELEVMEQHYSFLNHKCDKQVVPDHIHEKADRKPGESWPYGEGHKGGVGPQPGRPLGDGTSSPGAAATPTAKDSDIAEQAKRIYERAMHNEQQKMDAIDGFLGASEKGFAPPGYTPPAGSEGGFNGGRYQSTKSFGQVRRGYIQEAQNPTKGGAGKLDPKTDLTKRVVPKFPDIKAPMDGEPHVRNAAIAAKTRLECNAYILAFLQARDLYRKSLASDNREAAKVHSRSAVECAFQAKGYAQWAADHQHKADVVHQKLLDESLAAAAKKGLTVPVLLEKFQAKVKESGLPPHLDAAMTNAGATSEERAEAKARLLALMPETVEDVLKERRARIARNPEAPDAALLDLQLFLASEAHHSPDKK
jgi:hypothetical protein